MTIHSMFCDNVADVNIISQCLPSESRIHKWPEKDNHIVRNAPTSEEKNFLTEKEKMLKMTPINERFMA